MIEDCFEKWYFNRHQEVNPELDDLYDELFECYKAGWKRSLEVQVTLGLLTEMAQEEGQYD